MRPGAMRRRAGAERAGFRCARLRSAHTAAGHPGILLRSGLFTSQSAYPAREVAIILAALNHPALIDQDIEAFAALRFENAEIGRLQAALVDAVTEHHLARDLIRAAIDRAGHDALCARLQAALNPAEWWIDENAPPDDAERGFRDAVDLHLRASSLNQQRREAENRFLADGSDAAFRQLQDLVLALSALDGAEEETVDFRPASGGKRGAAG